MSVGGERAKESIGTASTLRLVRSSSKKNQCVSSLSFALSFVSSQEALLLLFHSKQTHQSVSPRGAAGRVHLGESGRGGWKKQIPDGNH